MLKALNQASLWIKPINLHQQTFPGFNRENRSCQALLFPVETFDRNLRGSRKRPVATYPLRAE